ncbi:MAG: DUF4340 domain-containing protein [Thermodesulfobacteriota bacterium]
MKPKALISYFLVFLALGLFYYLYEVKLAEKENRLREAGTRIYDLSFDQVKALKYRAGQTVYHIIREAPDRWRIVAPVQTPADRWEVENLIRAVLEGEKDRVFTEQVKNLAEFGLDQPGLSLSLMDGDRLLAPALHLGRENPMGQLIYGRLGETNEVFTVTSNFRQDLTKTLFELRDKALVLVPGEKIEGLNLFGREQVELARRGIRRWDVTRPAAGPADDNEVQKMIYQALKGRVIEFVAPQDGQDYGFDAPRVRMQVMSGGREAAAVIIGKAREKPGLDSSSPDRPQTGGPAAGDRPVYYARSTERPEIMLVTEETVRTLDRTWEEIKDRHVLDLDPRGLNAVTVTRGERRFRAEKVKNKDLWEVLEPSDSTSQDREVNAWLRALIDLKYVRLLDAADETVVRYGLKEPEMTIALEGPETAPVGLSVGLKPIEEKYLAVRAGQGAVALVNRNDFLSSLPREMRPAEKQGEKNKK